jgi:hypothetical protein
MKNLRLLIGAVVMTVSLGLMTPAFAQLGCNPGEMMGPPCATVQIVNDDSTDPGIIETSLVAQNFDLSSVAAELLSALLLF